MGQQHAGEQNTEKKTMQLQTEEQRGKRACALTARAMTSKATKELVRGPAAGAAQHRNRLTIQTTFRENTSEPARWSWMSGRMANPAPNTGYEPNHSNFFGYMDTQHTPIHLPWQPPRSPVSRPKQQLAEFFQCSNLEPSGGRSCVESSRPPGNWCGFGQRFCCNNGF